MTIDDFIPEPHPAKEIFIKKRIPQILIARALSCSRQRINQMLSGYVQPTPDEDFILRELAKEQAQADKKNSTG